ncbi:MAG TPA: hypothetical protein VIK86_07800 [Candidatus Paceibacterota bacterium]
MNNNTPNAGRNKAWSNTYRPEYTKIGYRLNNGGRAYNNEHGKEIYNLRQSNNKLTFKIIGESLNISRQAAQQFCDKYLRSINTLNN